MKSTDVDEHVRDEDAAGLVMLPATDPQRRAGELHAERCEPCRRRLRSAQRVMEVLDMAELSAPRRLEGASEAEERLARRVGLAGWQRRGAWGWVALVASVSGLLGLAAWGDTGDASMAKCAALEWVGGILTFALLLAASRRGAYAVTSAMGAAAAGSGALVIQLWLLSSCPDHHGVHVLVAHVGAVGLAVVLGALGGERAARRPAS